MQLSLKALAIISAVLCIAVMGTSEYEADVFYYSDVSDVNRPLTVHPCVLPPDGQQKRGECCREVSTKNITVPITGFRLQKWDPPCVKAVM